MATAAKAAAVATPVAMRMMLFMVVPSWVRRSCLRWFRPEFRLGHYCADGRGSAARVRTPQRQGWCEHHLFGFATGDGTPRCVYVDGIPTALGGDGDDLARVWALLSGVALVAL